jgi:hypothetical protein
MVFSNLYLGTLRRCIPRRRKFHRRVRRCFPRRRKFHRRGGIKRFPAVQECVHVRSKSFITVIDLFPVEESVLFQFAPVLLQRALVYLRSKLTLPRLGKGTGEFGLYGHFSFLSDCHLRLSGYGAAPSHGARNMRCTYEGAPLARPGGGTCDPLLLRERTRSLTALSDQRLTKLYNAILAILRV